MMHTPLLERAWTFTGARLSPILLAWASATAALNAVWDIRWTTVRKGKRWIMKADPRPSPTGDGVEAFAPDDAGLAFNLRVQDYARIVSSTSIAPSAPPGRRGGRVPAPSLRRRSANFAYLVPLRYAIIIGHPPRETPVPKKEIVSLNSAAGNPNLSPATTFGNLVFVAGQTGRHPSTGEIGKDIREQTRNVLERIKVVLEAAGTSLDNVLTATTYLTRRDYLDAYNEEYGKYFPTNKPARTTVTVASLNAPELMIEITVTACIPD
jgi:2-iminobutanoate/2-iminopropanoate deaminase